MSLAACGDKAWWSNNDEPGIRKPANQTSHSIVCMTVSHGLKILMTLVKDRTFPKTKQNVCSIVAVVDQNPILSPILKCQD